MDEFDESAYDDHEFCHDFDASPDTFDSIVRRMKAAEWQATMYIGDAGETDVFVTAFDPGGCNHTLTIDQDDVTASLSRELDRVMHDYDVQMPDHVDEGDDD